MKRRRMRLELLLGCWCGLLRDVGGELALMVEIQRDGRGFALIPGVLVDREVEDDHAFGVRPGLDGGFAKKRRRGERLKPREGGVDVVEVALLNGGGGNCGVFGPDEGTGDVFQEERYVQVVMDVDGGEDVEGILCGIFHADDPCGGRNDCVCRQGGYVW